MTEDKTTKRQHVQFDPAHYRRQMVKMGVTQTRVSEVSSIPQADISAMLNGRDYIGPKRRAKLQDALHQLALEVKAKRKAEAAVAGTDTEGKEQPKSSPNIRPT